MCIGKLKQQETAAAASLAEEKLFFFFREEATAAAASRIQARERERVVYRSGAARPFDSVVPGQQRRQRIGNNWIETVNGWGIGKGKKKKKSPFSPLCANRFDPSVRSGRIGTEQQEISDRRHTKRRRKTEQQPTNLFLNGSCLPLGRVQSSYISDKVAKLFVVLLLLLLE